MERTCVGEAELERMAQGGNGPAGVRDHLARCTTCRARLDEIRENQAFLGARAGGLARAFDATLADAPGVEPTTTDSVPGYELIGEISRGGQGVVYRAVQSSTKRVAALKMLLSGALATERQRARFDREIEIAASLRHPSIVTVFESGRTRDGRQYISMEFVEGIPLDDYIRERFGPPTEGGRERVEAVMRLMQTVASAAGHAHGAGVMHRDLKPSNILVDERGTPRILDFGLARAVEVVSGATMTVEFVGTPAFAAPEQFSGGSGSASPATDVYALGLIAYQALTGAMPYPVEVPLTHLAQIVTSLEPDPPSRLLPRLSADVETIIMKCLAKDPARRYPNGDALAADIGDFLAGRPISAKRDSTLYMLSMLAKRHKAPAAAAALVLMTIIAAAIALAILARDLDAERRNAESALAASTVQRARLMAAAGDMDRAESILWSEARRAEMDDRLDLGDAPEGRRAVWALMEIYAHQPRVFRAPIDGQPTRVGFAPDGRVWVADHTGRRHWWSQSGTALPSSPIELEAGDSAVSSRNGRFVVLRTGESAMVRDLDKGRTTSGPAPWPRDDEIMAVSDDGMLIASIRGSHRVARLTDARTLRPIGEFEAGTTRVFLCRRVDRDALLITRMSDGVPCIVVRESPAWEVAAIVLAPEAIRSGNQSPFKMPDFDAAGNVLFTGLTEHILRFDVRTNPPAMTGDFGSHSPINTLDLDEERALLAASLMDGTLALHRADDLSRIVSFANGAPGRVAISPDGRNMAIADQDRRINVYESTSRGWLEKIESTPMTHAAIDAARDGTIAWIDDRGDLFICATSPPHDITIIHAHDKEATSVDWSPDGTRVLTAAFDGAVREWNRDGTARRTIIEGLPQAWCARYAPDATAIAVGDGKGVIRIWLDASNEPSFVFETGADRIPQVEFSPDGRLLACATINRNCPVLEMATGRELFHLSGHGEFTRAIAFSPDGALIVTGGDDRAVRVWNAASGTLLRTIDGLAWSPFDFAFHPSGRALFVAGRGREILVLDPEAGTELASIELHDRFIFSLAFDPTGSRLYTSGQDPWIGIVDLDHLRSYVRGNWRYGMEQAGRE